MKKMLLFICFWFSFVSRASSLNEELDPFVLSVDATFLDAEGYSKEVKLFIVPSRLTGADLENKILKSLSEMSVREESYDIEESMWQASLGLIETKEKLQKLQEQVVDHEDYDLFLQQEALRALNEKYKKTLEEHEKLEQRDKLNTKKIAQGYRVLRESHYNLIVDNQFVLDKQKAVDLSKVKHILLSSISFDL